MRSGGVGTLLVLFAAGAAGAAGAAAAQQRDTLATFTGTVRSTQDGQPIPGVMVALRGATSAFHVSDSIGAFRITRMPAGRYTLRLAFAEHVAEDYQIHLLPGHTMELTIMLDARGVELAPIVVEAASQEYALSLAGFYHRRGRGLGRFVTHDEIERRHPAHLSQMLAGTGITMRCQRTLCVPVRNASGRRCAVSVFLDGVPVEDYNIDLIPPEDVLGLEVYRQGSDTPAEFSHFSAACGALVIWTKN